MLMDTMILGFTRTVNVTVFMNGFFDVMFKQNHRTVVMFMVLLNEALFIAVDIAVTPTPTQH